MLQCDEINAAAHSQGAILLARARRQERLMGNAFTAQAARFCEIFVLLFLFAKIFQSASTEFSVFSVCCKVDSWESSVSNNGA